MLMMYLTGVVALDGGNGQVLNLMKLFRRVQGFFFADQSILAFSCCFCLNIIIIAMIYIHINIIIILIMIYYFVFLLVFCEVHILFYIHELSLADFIAKARYLEKVNLF